MNTIWRRVKLGDVAEAQAGFAFKSGRFTDDPNDIPLVKGENVGQGRILWNISKRWPAAEWWEFATYHLRAGDVVVAMDRPWVPAGLKWAPIRDGDPDALLVQRVARLRTASGDLEQRYLPVLIGSPLFDDYLRPITTGVNVPHVSARQILDFEFSLPPVAVQHRIAAVLAAYGDLIDNNLSRIQILREMARSIYREWFVRFRFPGHEGIGRVDSLLGPIPEGWVGRFDDLLSIDRDGLDPGDFPDERFQHFSIPAFDDGQLPVEEAGSVIKSTKYLIDGKCVLLSKLNPRIPRVWRPRPSDGLRAVASTEFLVLRPRVSALRDFIFATCSSVEFTGRFVALSVGTSTSHQRVKPQDVLSFAVIVPPRPILEAFSQSVGPIYDLIQVLREQSAVLRRTRDLLLPRLMSGQLTLPEAEEAIPTPL